MAVDDAACADYRDADGGPDFGQDVAHRPVGPQVAAGFFAFDDNGGGTELLRQVRQLGRRHDRNDGDAVFPAPGEHIAGEPGARQDEVDFFGQRRLDQLGKLADREQHVDAKDPTAHFFGLADLALQFPDRHAGSRNDADSALIGDGGGQSGGRNTDGHTTLDDRADGCQVGYFQ